MPIRLFNPIRSRDAQAGWPRLPSQDPPCASASMLVIAIVSAALAFMLTGPDPDTEARSNGQTASAAACQNPPQPATVNVSK
ncbi:hypothetical protein [Amantichitinum ursilacus]|uniref:Uncharacterized protein n=1 Tax=Amantichitinum ursilacus TaxID=857265 RepID=A0A0N0XJC0_9NEIS|nr:hypothetical protein [Amantichitinum ursilacus]KPC50564.1 hypothetical protein WG78_17205 [Amantichitinum ursilacus]